VAAKHVKRLLRPQAALAAFGCFPIGESDLGSVLNRPGVHRPRDAVLTLLRCMIKADDGRGMIMILDPLRLVESEFGAARWPSDKVGASHDTNGKAPSPHPLRCTPVACTPQLLFRYHQRALGTRARVSCK